MSKKFKSRYEAYIEKKGTENKLPSLTDQSEAQESEIYAMIEKYGIKSLMQQSKNEEPLYLDLTQIHNLTLDEAFRQKKELNEYFENMPAKARKVFGDNADEFYERFKQGNFDKFIETNALTNEMANQITNERNNILKEQKEELKQEILKEIESDFQGTIGVKGV